jgi:tetratricopeptide (TPR) repeat protein
LARLQGLPDAFDGGLAAAMLKQNTGDEIARLLKYSLLRRVDALYVVPPTVRALLQQYFPLGPHERDAADAAALEYLIRSWPQEDSPQRRAWLGNLRAILFRLQNRNVPVKILAQVLVVTAVAFRETGLSDEFLTYAGTVREQLPEGDLLARLQIAMGETLSAMPGRETEAGWLLEVTQRVEGAVRAQAGLAYGRYLVQVGQLEAAEQVLLRALQMLVKDRDADIVLAASLTHEWANVLIAAGRSEEAIPRYEAALAGYAQSQRADLSVEARRDFADVLVSLGDVDRAEDLLRRTLITADQIGQRAVSAQLRQRLATITATRAASDPGEWQSAESLLGDAVHDLLPQAGAWVALAGVYHELSRVQARLGRVDSAIAHASRSRAWFEDAGCLAESAAAALTLGQLSMAQGNAVAAQATLHEALDLAEVAGDATLAAQVAGVLVRVHQIRARYARQADPSFRQDTVKQANFTLARLAGLGLDDHVAALDAVVREIGPGVDVNE